MSQPALTLAPTPPERQQHIAEIKQQLMEDGFAAKDMFLTTELVQQMAAPDREDPEAYALWWRREDRRRQLFRRMTLYGLTAHDLAPGCRAGAAPGLRMAVPELTAEWQ
jgi:hypothetical protein